MICLNIEGYRRNVYYLNSLVRKYQPIFIFIQEHWLPHYQAEKKLSDDFPLYSFSTSSSDMFLNAEEKMIDSGAAWHGTAIGWLKNVNAEAFKIPIVDDRFCQELRGRVFQKRLLF